MADLQTDLRKAFETEGYDVAEVETNRDRIRVVILDDEASGEALRSLTHDVVDESDILGLDVSTESVESDEGVTTVVSFRHRG
jgi:hypothetical protein